MQKRIVGFFLSVASVCITMDFITKLFIDMMSNLTFSVI
jgi:hypothetical protein